jgi:hypothetical protein
MQVLTASDGQTKQHRNEAMPRSRDASKTWGRHQQMQVSIKGEVK